MVLRSLSGCDSVGLWIRTTIRALGRLKDSTKVVCLEFLSAGLLGNDSDRSKGYQTNLMEPPLVSVTYL
jgi:hypothetical protein